MEERSGVLRYLVVCTFDKNHLITLRNDGAVSSIAINSQGDVSNRWYCMYLFTRGGIPYAVAIRNPEIRIYRLCGTLPELLFLCIDGRNIPLYALSDEEKVIPIGVFQRVIYPDLDGCIYFVEKHGSDAIIINVESYEVRYDSLGGRKGTDDQYIPAYYNQMYDLHYMIRYDGKRVLNRTFTVKPTECNRVKIIDTGLIGCRFLLNGDSIYTNGSGYINVDTYSLAYGTKIGTVLGGHISCAFACDSENILVFIRYSCRLGELQLVYHNLSDGSEYNVSVECGIESVEKAFIL